MSQFDVWLADPDFQSRLTRSQQTLSQNVAAALYRSAMEGSVAAQTFYLRHLPPPEWPRRRVTPPPRPAPSTNSRMTNSLNASERDLLLQLVRGWEQTARTELLRSPARFRELLLLSRSPPTRLSDVLQPWQLRDLAALDAAWRTLAGATSAAPLPASRRVRRSYIERPRGHSKTTDISVQILWILLAAEHRLSGLAAAADRDQAKLIQRAMQRIADANPELCASLRFLESLVRNLETGSQLEIISSDVRSSYGALPDFVVCDELCHWKAEELWHSLLSSAAKKPDCVLAVLTNAGVGRGWQWRLREHARSSPEWHFSSLVGPHAPWITDDALAEQRALLPEPVFERLWLNLWQHSDGEFVTLAEAERCRDDQLSYQLIGRHDVAYVAAIDYAEKRDFTVGCVCHHDGARVIVDRMDVVKPTPDRPTPVQWVEDWIEEVAAGFPQVRFVVDPYQLVQLVQQMETRFDVERFNFQGGAGNHRLATTLHQLVAERRIAWYPDCGAVPSRDPRERDDIETELAALIVRNSSHGRMRFDHLRDGLHHDDRAFTLALAALSLYDAPVVSPFLDITSPGPDGGFGEW